MHLGKVIKLKGPSCYCILFYVTIYLKHVCVYLKSFCELMIEVGRYCFQSADARQTSHQQPCWQLCEAELQHSSVLS